MATTLNNTLSDELANSYVDLPYASGYFAGHINAAYAAQWAALTPQQQTGILTRACTVIEQCRFVIDARLPQYQVLFNRQSRMIIDMALTREPMRWFYYQRLQFPRNLDVYYTTAPAGFKIGDRYIPEPILWGQCEQAIYMLNLDSSAIINRMQGITEETVTLGKGQVTTTQKYGGMGTTFAPAAYELVYPYFYKDGKVGRG